VSPEKEKRLIEVAQAYEAAVQRAVELKEKRDKLRASMNEVQKQLEAAAAQAEATERAMFEVVAAGLPPLPSTYAGDALQGGQSIVRLSDLGPRIGSPLSTAGRQFAAIQDPPDKASIMRGIAGAAGYGGGVLPA
jgi:hypothetical protein